MSGDLALDPASGTPPYEQIRQQVAEQVADGRLREGDRLPTVRGLADRLGVAPGTVARAYKELESDGLVAGLGRAGTVVTGGPPAIGAQVRAAAERLADLAERDGLGETAVLDLVRNLLRAARTP